MSVPNFGKKMPRSFGLGYRFASDLVVDERILETSVQRFEHSY